MIQTNILATRKTSTWIICHSVLSLIKAIVEFVVSGYLWPSNQLGRWWWRVKFWGSCFSKFNLWSNCVKLNSLQQDNIIPHFDTEIIKLLTSDDQKGYKHFKTLIIPTNILARRKMVIWGYWLLYRVFENNVQKFEGHVVRSKITQTQRPQINCLLVFLVIDEIVDDNIYE